ncbi:hypothetical protein CEF21_21440 [Bacillus sp. FJAT-42376]|uniref:pre-toxin TG domain-containing protein n=1 Tax=Bacillus sp. FJAT-42376 TaxID=2014076 RepID=UPI000F4D4EE4|nr:pre-toxin TG domain-containing protein [Bacillus sp. FJAT-42376]AZB44646.1 hypothetical protein CEF21_21440 [Bacillus sp. FJAT-42376]
MTDIQIKPQELLELAQKIGQSIQIAQEGQSIITKASSYATTADIEHAKMNLLKQLETYLGKLDHGHQKVFIARELMLGTDKNCAAIYAENPWDVPKSIKDNPMAIIEWKRKHIYFENGVLVNPMGNVETPKSTIKKTSPKINYKSIVRTLPKTKLVKKKNKLAEALRDSVEMQLNTHPATMGTLDQLKTLTGRDPLTWKKISDLERKRAGSAWLDSIPGISNFKSAKELSSGENAITKEKLSNFDKVVAAITIGGGAYTRPLKPGIRAIKNIPKQLVRKADDMVGKVDVKTGSYRSLDKKIGNAYDIAKNGGKHSGFYKQYINKSPEEIKKGIQSINKQISEHQDKIKNPEKSIPNFKNLDPRQQEALINKKWPSDIQRQMEQKRILEGILRGK